MQGDETISSFITALLSPPSWKDEEDRFKAERGGFTLLLSKLFSAGEDNIETAMKALARLLAVDAKKLEDIIDADSLAVILKTLDVDGPIPLRSQATLVVAKFLEASTKRGQALLAEFMVAQIAKRTNDDLVIAFSAAAAIFPVAPAIAATIFLTEDFILELAGFANKTRSTRVRHALLELLSAACIEKTSREAVLKHFTRWLKQYLADGKNKDDVALAALILSKTGELYSTTKPSQQIDGDRPDLVALFKDMLSKPGERNLHSSIEGLAYASIQAQVKEDLSIDPKFLKDLLREINAAPIGDASLFGGLNIIANICTYTPKLSAEEKRIDDLKAYANASTPGAPNVLNSDAHVTGRCSKILAAGTVPVLVKVSKKTTPSILALTSKILLNLTHNLKHCGRMIQEGAYENAYRCASLAAPDTDSLLMRAKLDGAHTLARLLIPTDPALVFTQRRSANDAVRALSQLLVPPDDLPAGLEGRDTQGRSLYTLHGLRALTNIASFDDKACDVIALTCFPGIETALWSESVSERDAAVELVCNMVQRSGVAISQFAGQDGGSPEEVKAATTRLQILWACVDAERTQTRYAALAAVGTLLQFAQIAKVFMGLNGRGVEALVEYLKEADAQIRTLALVAVGELLGVEGEGDAESLDVVEKTRKRLDAVGAGDVLEGLRKAPGEQQGMVTACLKALRRR